MKEILLEDKALITKALFEALKLTRSCRNLESLTYRRDLDTMEEWVHAKWKGEGDNLDYHNEIDVTADSGFALILDVCKAI